MGDESSDVKLVEGGRGGKFVARNILHKHSSTPSLLGTGLDIECVIG